MREKVDKNLELILLPIIFVILFFSTKFLWTYFNLPSQEGILEFVKSVFAEYGLIIVFLGAIFEATIFLGSYFPGTIVIFLGVAVAHGNPILAIYTVFLACLGLFVGHNINYFLGKYAFQRIIKVMDMQTDVENFKSKIDEKGVLFGFPFYILPGSGAIFTATLGLLKYNYFKFLIFIIFTVLFWNIFWGILAYYFGIAIFESLNSWIMLFIGLSMALLFLHLTGKLKIN